MFRDKRVRNVAFVMPSLIIVMLMFLLGFLQDRVSEPSNIKLYIVSGMPGEIQKELKDSKAQVFEINSVNEGKELIQEGKANIVLAASGSFRNIANGKQVELDAYYDPKKELSKVDLEAVRSDVNEVNKADTDKVLSAKGISEAEAEPFKFAQKEVVVGGTNAASELIVSLLPYLIVIWAFYGGMSIATELVAGEKDKNTLETLLISPATRTQIAIGKFLSLCVVCLVSSLSSFIGLIIVEYSHMGITQKLFPHGLGLTPESALLILLVLLPTVGLFAAILLAISTYAKNPREAQTYLAGVSFLVLMPAMCSQFIGYTDFANSSWLYLIPVLNTATVIRQALQSQVNVSGMATCIALSLILAAIGIKAAVHLFNREAVLVRI